ncbi:MAG: MATE family efflux transporter [Firmicutes bacterium]|nr:MATE family efflux transporter [Bacillota bacterium]
MKNPLKQELNKTLWKLALPIILQNALSTSLNLIDSLMIGQISSNSNAEFVAVGFANQIFFILTLFITGFTCAAQVFSAQYYGNGDYDGINKSLGMGLLSCGGFCLLVQILGCVFPEQSMMLFTNDAQVIKLGGSYMSIVSWSYAATGLTFVYSAVLRSVRRVKLPMISAVIGVCSNTLLNWLLIYGNLGCPRLGIRGAAIATLASRLLQIAIILIFVYYPRTGLSATPKQLFGFSRAFAAKYLKCTLPVVANEGLWGVGTGIYTVYYGRIGTAAAAAAMVAANLEQFAWIFIASLGTVTAIILGNALGSEDEFKNVRFYARQMQKNIILWAIGLSIMLAAFSGVFPSLFSLDAEAISLSTPLILILALLIPFKSANFNRVIGILRAGGDTAFTCILESLLIWGITVPLGYLFYGPLGLGIIPVFSVVHIDEIIKMPILAMRCKKGRWIRNLTKEGVK